MLYNLNFSFNILKTKTMDQNFDEKLGVCSQMVGRLYAANSSVLPSITP